MTQLPFACGGPPLHGVLRAKPEDFQVTEELGYAADGAGEHVLLVVEKRDANTQWVAGQLAHLAGVAVREVGFAGLKDRHAVTRQSFSVGLAGRPEPDWSALDDAQVRVVSATRHRRKIKRGALRGNRFELVVRDVAGDRERAEQVLECIRVRGVPNYFGEQRFGHGGANVERARAMFGGRRVDRATRSLLLSAARSELFNQVLGRRVADQVWNQPLEGEIWCLAGSRSWFGPEPWTDALRERLARGDIHPSGPLWGRGPLPSAAVVAAREQAVAADLPDLVAGLEQVGMEPDRRALRLLPEALAWSWPDVATLRVSFALPAGAYATVVVRELVATDLAVD